MKGVNMTSSTILPTPEFPVNFERVGRYDPALPGFLLETEKPEDYRGLYAWVDICGDTFIMLRIGVAWGGGLKGRIYDMHNPWLAGTKWKSDYEQLKRWATIQCAPAGMIVMGCRMPTEDAAYAAEEVLRDRHYATSSLDFSVLGSAVKRRRDELRKHWERTGDILPLFA